MSRRPGTPSTGTPSTGSTPASRAGRYTVRTGTLVSLLAGRASYRLIQLSTSVLLLLAWGADTYAAYATASAVFAWVLALVVSGPEKTVLKLLPRGPRTGLMITEALAGVLWWLPLPLVAAFVLVLVATDGGDQAVYVGVAAMMLSAGCTMLLIGVHRALRRPRWDAVSFLVMSLAQLLALAGAAAGPLGPVGYVGFVTGVQLTLNVLLSVTLGRPSARIRHRPGFVRRLAWTSLLLAGPEVGRSLSIGVLFALLAQSATAAQLSRLYVIVVIWFSGVNLLVYLLRVYAPRTSLRLAGRAGHAGRRRAARLSTAAAVIDAGWLAALTLALATTGLAGITSPTSLTVVWAVLMATRAPTAAVVLWASYLLENTDATAVRVSGLAAVVGLGTTAATALGAVPAAGGTGLIASLTAGQLGYAVVVAARGRSHRHRSPPASVLTPGVARYGRRTGPRSRGG